MKILKNSILSLLFISLSMFGLTALAQTPDGETPANEGVCDGLVGYTPGLYGLCVAFCEAQDAEATLDTATGAVTFSPGSRPSDPKVLDRYNKKKALGDPPMPCVNIVEPPGCIAWTEAELDMVADTMPVRYTNRCWFHEGWYSDDHCSVGLSGYDDADANNLVLEFADVRNDRDVAYYNIVRVQFVDHTGGTVIHRNFGNSVLSDEEFGLCRDSLDAELDSRGL